ncbi:unannotated protein [freshwater metagenome]|uniref:Unannotated protein n=1 Tax=freshwater metagenome TaxID=449393 RepID=A0A6J7FI17_9ZZZZ|nr:sigma-70 family RNA polymerase sigma factor [Actinomycetota bacterium]
MLHEVPRRDQIDLDLLRRYRDRDDRFALEELADRSMPLVKSIARKYRNCGEDMEDLIQAGTVGLVKAIERFDLESGGRFISYAVPNIQGEIRRHFRDHTWAVHVPRSMQELDAKIQTTSRRVAAKTGQHPTDEDLATELQAPVSDIREARSAGRSYRALSLDAPAGEDRDIAGTFGRSDPGYAGVENTATVDVAMQALCDRDRKVVRLRYEDGLLQREIAEEIGVSQMQVSRILSAAVDQMHEHLDTGSRPTPLAA